MVSDNHNRSYESGPPLNKRGTVDARFRAEPSAKQLTILDLRSKGNSFGQIAEVIGCSKQYAHYAYRRWRHYQAR